jgi:hypothetical protein
MKPYIVWRQGLPRFAGQGPDGLDYFKSDLVRVGRVFASTSAQALVQAKAAGFFSPVVQAADAHKAAQQAAQIIEAAQQSAWSQTRRSQ